MLTKITLLSLLTFSALCNHQTNQGNNIQSAQYPQYPGAPNSYELENDIVIAGTVIAVIFGLLIVVGINVFLCMKCYHKRAIGKKIKEQMLFKRL
jgi:hypothetical protein